ncbi:MAG: platelet-activating factor acetylhydrolase IB subunit [Planctomycetota bacterium]
MKRKLLALYIGVVILSAIAPAVGAEKHSAVDPAHRHSWWTLRHWAVNERIKQGNVDMIFIGDSITHSWEGGGKEVWQKYYGHRNAVNMGFSGDRTQHVLWRLDNGNIDGISPKVAVIMIGTNNSNRDDNTAEEIADGMIAICKKLRAKLPRTKILLLAVFPRAEKPCPQREKIAKANKIASKIADGRMIHYLDIGPKFLEPDESISKEIMPDYLHLTPKGYKIWARAIEPTVTKLMGDKK